MAKINARKVPTPPDIQITMDAKSAEILKFVLANLTCQDRSAQPHLNVLYAALLEVGVNTARDIDISAFGFIGKAE